MAIWSVMRLLQVFGLPFSNVRIDGISIDINLGEKVLLHLLDINQQQYHSQTKFYPIIIIINTTTSICVCSYFESHTNRQIALFEVYRIGSIYYDTSSHIIYERQNIQGSKHQCTTVDPSIFNYIVFPQGHHFV